MSQVATPCGPITLSDPNGVAKVAEETSEGWVALLSCKPGYAPIEGSTETLICPTGAEAWEGSLECAKRSGRKRRYPRIINWYRGRLSDGQWTAGGRPADGCRRHACRQRRRKKNHLIEAAPFGRIDQMWPTTV